MDSIGGGRLAIGGDNRGGGRGASGCFLGVEGGRGFLGEGSEETTGSKGGDIFDCI